MVGGGYCRECFEKQRQIDRLTQDNARLRVRLRYQERVSREEGFFGSSTPSAKLPVKPNSRTGKGATIQMFSTRARRSKMIICSATGITKAKAIG